MKLPVHRSVPVSRMMTRPKGKIIAPSIVINPGAFSWYHGETETINVAAQAKERMQPARNELKNTLSARILPFIVPAREQSSVVSLGV